MTLWAALGLFLSGLLPAWSQSVIVRLSNGDRLSGVVTARTSSHLHLETFLGTLAIPLSQVVQEEVAPAAPVLGTNLVEATREALKGLSTEYQAGKITPADYHRRRGGLLEEAERAGVQRGALSEGSWAAGLTGLTVLQAAKTSGAGQEAKGTKHWSGEASVGTDLAFGTKDRQLFTGRIQGAYTESRFRNTWDYLFTYGKTDGELTADRMDGSMKTDVGVSPKFYAYNIGGGGYDEIRKIDLRYQFGPGVGYELVKAKWVQLGVEIGINYQVEERTDSDDTERFYYRLADIATLQITSNLSLDQKFEFFPQVEEPRQYRFRFETNLRYVLSGNIALLVTLLDQYDTDPAEDVEKNDLQIRSSIGMKF